MKRSRYSSSVRSPYSWRPGTPHSLSAAHPRRGGGRRCPVDVNHVSRHRRPGDAIRRSCHRRGGVTHRPYRRPARADRRRRRGHAVRPRRDRPDRRRAVAHRRVVTVRPGAHPRGASVETAARVGTASRRALKRRRQRRPVRRLRQALSPGPARADPARTAVRPARARAAWPTRAAIQPASAPQRGAARRLAAWIRSGRVARDLQRAPVPASAVGQVRGGRVRVASGPARAVWVPQAEPWVRRAA